MSGFLPAAPYTRAMLANALGCGVPSDAADSFASKTFDERLAVVVAEIDAMPPEDRKKVSTLLRPYIRRAVGDGE